MIECSTRFAQWAL